MIDTGIILSLPTESIAIRVVMASVAAVCCARLLLRAGLRVPRVRAVAAMVPAVALAAVLVLFGTNLALPSLWVPVDAVDALPVPVRDTYLTFAPLAAPILVGMWAAIALLRLLLRARRVHRMRARTMAAFHAGRAAPARVHQTVGRLATKMRIPAPAVALVDECPGGATVVGLRRPVMVIDAALERRLDDRELEGVLAHELAHIRRRDNLVSVALGAVRDLFFFVPGGAWALRQLHAEREVAADSLAVQTTSRPAALASGLLKVIDGGDEHVACAALMPRGSLVRRVESLIDERPPVGRVRAGVEGVAVLVVVSLSVAAAGQIPGVISGTDGEREALGVMWSSVSTDTPVSPATNGPSPESRVFQTYRDSRLDGTPEAILRIAVVDDPDDVRPSVLRGCLLTADCPERSPSHTLGLRPRPVIRMDMNLVDRWRVDPLVTAGEGLSVFWFQRRTEQLQQVE